MIGDKVVYVKIGMVSSSSVVDVGITLRVTIIALSYTAQLEAHEDTRRQGGPLGRCRRRFVEEQDGEEPNKESLRLGLL
jgi:hypothetical protein